MEFLNSPTNLLIVGIGFVVLYSLGQYGWHRYGEYGKLIGLGGTALVILKLFWSFCPAVAVYYLFPLLAAALISQFVFWAIHRIRGLLKPRIKFSFESRVRPRNNKATEKPARSTASIHQRSKEPASRPSNIVRMHLKQK